MASGDVDRLRDDQWERLRDLVPGGREGQRGLRCDNRRFVDALLWMAVPVRWRDLPDRFGDHQAVKRRPCRWIARGAPGGFLAVLTAQPDLERLMPASIADDRQHHRARPPARGRCAHCDAHCKGWPDAQGPGRSRDGPSTKVHPGTDAFGNPVRLLFGPGQRRDATRSHELITGLNPKTVIADKDMTPTVRTRPSVTPERSWSFQPDRATKRRPHDRALCKERNPVERFFNKPKQFRSVATRYDKLPANYAGFVQLAALSFYSGRIGATTWFQCLPNRQQPKVMIHRQRYPMFQQSLNVGR